LYYLLLLLKLEGFPASPDNFYLLLTPSQWLQL